MAQTNTTLQQLEKPTAGTAPPVDIDLINRNMDKIDKIGVVFCTSTTRPTVGLFNGLLIYETDTKVHKKWDGAKWVGKEWTDLTPAGGWQDGAGQNLEFCQDINGVVTVSGVIYNTAGYTPSSIAVMTTLPANYRPAAALLICVTTNNTPGNWVQGEIQADGDIVAFRGVAQGAVSWHSISAQFRAA